MVAGRDLRAGLHQPEGAKVDFQLVSRLSCAGMQLGRYDRTDSDVEPLELLEAWHE